MERERRGSVRSRERERRSRGGGKERGRESDVNVRFEGCEQRVVFADVADEEFVDP